MLTTIAALGGEIRSDEPTRTAAADDFGHLVHRTPHAVLRPASARDVAVTVRWAAGQGRRFAPQGCRHSVFGRSQVAGGVVADMTALRSVHGVEDDRVTVDAGATWREVLAATLPHGRVPAGLPDYLDLSVGGTLAVGGVGARISEMGTLCDNVLALEVVTGRGEILTCSPRDRADLFDAVRAGLGQVAVVTRATLTLVPASLHVHRYLLQYPDLPTMLADQRLLARDGRFGAVQGAAVPDPAGGWAFRLDAVADGDPADDLLAGLADDRRQAQVTALTQLEHLDRLAQLERALRAAGQWSLPHPWLTTFVGDARIETVVDDELDRLTPDDLGPFGQVTVSAFRRSSVTCPLLRLPADDVCFTFNLIRNPMTVESDRLVADNRGVYERVRAAGGMLYPPSALPMSSEDWREHFGPAFDRLHAAKEEFDPDHVLTPGYEVF